MTAEPIGAFAKHVATTRPPLDFRLATALGEALDMLAEHERVPAALLDVLCDAEAKFASIRRAELEARNVG